MGILFTTKAKDMGLFFFRTFSWFSLDYKRKQLYFINYSQKESHRISKLEWVSGWPRSRDMERESDMSERHFRSAWMSSLSFHINQKRRAFFPITQVTPASLFS
jgi:hypothetical protein